MVVDGEIRKSEILRASYLMRHELTAQVPIAPGAWHVVDVVLGEGDISNEQPRAASASGDTAEEDRSVLILIARKEVGAESAPLPFRDVKLVGGHRVLSHSRTFSIFCTAVERHRI